MSNSETFITKLDRLTMIVGMELFFDHLSNEAIKQLKLDFGNKAEINDRKAKVLYMFQTPRQVATEDLEISIFALVEHMRIYCQDKSYQMVKMDLFTCSRTDFDQAVATGSKHILHKFEVKTANE